MFITELPEFIRGPPRDKRSLTPAEKHGAGKIEEDDESKTKIAYANKDLLTTAVALEMLTDRFYNLITDTTGLQITSYGKGRWLDPTDTQRHHYIKTTIEA